MAVLLRSCAGVEEALGVAPLGTARPIWTWRPCETRHEVASRLKGLEANACPFANLPEKKRTQWALTKEEMKNCMWLKPELVAQVEFTEWTPDGHLRHSKFVGLREDKTARQVVREIES